MTQLGALDDGQSTCESATCIRLVLLHPTTYRRLTEIEIATDLPNGAVVTQAQPWNVH